MTTLDEFEKRVIEMYKGKCIRPLFQENEFVEAYKTKYECRSVPYPRFGFQSVADMLRSLNTIQTVSGDYFFLKRDCPSVAELELRLVDIVKKSPTTYEDLFDTFYRSYSQKDAPPEIFTFDGFKKLLNGIPSLRSDDGVQLHVINCPIWRREAAEKRKDPLDPQQARKDALKQLKARLVLTGRFSRYFTASDLAKKYMESYNSYEVPYRRFGYRSFPQLLQSMIEFKTTTDNRYYVQSDDLFVGSFIRLLLRSRDETVECKSFHDSLRERIFMSRALNNFDNFLRFLLNIKGLKFSGSGSAMRVGRDPLDTTVYEEHTEFYDEEEGVKREERDAEESRMDCDGGGDGGGRGEDDGYEDMNQNRRKTRSPYFSTNVTTRSSAGADATGTRRQAMGGRASESTDFMDFNEKMDTEGGNGRDEEEAEVKEEEPSDGEYGIGDGSCFDNDYDDAPADDHTPNNSTNSNLSINPAEDEVKEEDPSDGEYGIGEGPLFARGNFEDVIVPPPPPAPIKREKKKKPYSIIKKKGANEAYGKLVAMALNEAQKKGMDVEAIGTRLVQNAVQLCMKGKPKAT